MVELVFCVFDTRPKPSPKPKRGLLHPAPVHVFKSSPMLGGRLQIQLLSRHRGVVVRDLKGRERTVRGDAEPPLGLKMCSRARQGGRGERHCLLTTGNRGVDVTFVNGHRRLYRTHPGRTGLVVPLYVCTPRPAPTSPLLLGIRIFSGCLNLPSGVQHHSVFASTTVTAPSRQHVHRTNPTSLANIICRFVRGSGIRNWRLSLNTAYEFQ